MRSFSGRRTTRYRAENGRVMSEIDPVRPATTDDCQNFSFMSRYRIPANRKKKRLSLLPVMKFQNSERNPGTEQRDKKEIMRFLVHDQEEPAAGDKEHDQEDIVYLDTLEDQNKLEKPEQEQGVGG